MKKINRFLILCILVGYTAITNAQNIQMPKWPLNGLEIDFTQSQIQVNSMNSSLTGAKGSSNGYYDENDDLLFHIIDTKLYAPDGTEVGDLYTDEDNTADEMGSEIIVIPAEPEDNCLYYVIYTIQQHNDDNSHIWKVCYNLVCWHGPTIVDSGVLCSMSGECHGAIAVSDFVTDNGDTYHRLEAVGSGILTNHGQFQYINGELRLMVQTVLPNTYGYDFCELEMSKDGKVLAAAHLNVDQDNNYSIDPYNITIWILDDDLLPSVVYNADIGTPNSQTEQFTGVEIYQDPNNPDDKYIYFNKYGGGKYMIPVFGTSIWPFDPFEFSVSPLYSSSHLELARDGNIYSTNGGQNLYLVDPYDANNNTVKVIGTHNPVRNDYIESSHANAPLVFALPDQVDQANYSAYTTGTEFDCCQASYESLIKTSMAGVSFDANGNITISGSNVYWTQSSNPFTSGSQTITDIYLKGDLVIDPGAKLTVDGLKLHFKESETLDMSFNSGGVGSRLVLNNSTLTVFDECDEDIMWGGISCSGDWSYVPQGSTSTSPQPYTYMSNSTIEFAEKGIEANNGGIVKAYNSSFKDNIIDVSFVSYSYQGVDNISLFSTCEFYTTSDLYNKGYTPSYHAHIWTAPGLEFYGCSFRNEYASSVAVSQRGGGILSTSSSIIVKEKCSGFVQLGYPCPDQYTTRGEFEDLYYAIKASSGSFMTLSRQDFIDCPKGAWLIDCDAIKVTECDFDVSSETLSGSYLYDSYGLYVESSTGYHIEGNEFHDGVLGLVVYDSGIDENLIYKNTFYNLSGNGNATGLVAIGENGALTSKLFPQISGLQMRCNTFNDVDYSMAVLGGTIQTTDPVPPTITSSNIRKIQGTDDQGALISTHNEFININSTPYEYHYLYFDPSVSTMPGLYVYHQTAASGYYIPTNCVQTTEFTTLDLSAETCPQTIYTGGGIIIPLMETIGGLNDEEIALENELSELTSYDEIALEISAQTATESNTSEVYNSLNEESPYLTSEILLAYLNNINVSELSRASLMLANSPLPTNVVDAVNESDLSPAYKAHILNYQNGKNPLEQKQNRINSLKSARQVNYDKLIMATFESDTTPDFADTYEMVLGFMETQADTHAKKKLADMYIHKGLFDNALPILCDLENIALISENTALYNDVKLKEIKIDINRTYSIEATQNVIVENEEYLRELASDYNTKEGGAARAMLELAGLWDNFPIVFLPNPEIIMEDKSAIISNDSDDLIPELESLFSIYPNPADDFLSIEFINPNGTCTFSIYSIKGELIKTVSSNQSLGFISIDISNLDSGNYIITCPELNESQNFMIIR